MVNPDLHESHDLIASDRVVGTAVYDMNGENVALSSESSWKSAAAASHML